jgi:uncharacterized membrane protein
MQKLNRYFLSWVRSALQSLAFLPLPMMLGALLFGIGLFYVEMNTDISREITARLPSSVLSSQDTARAVLTLIIGGLITLTVFTFTQMMTLFSQVSSSYSPRLLPYFTSSRALQFVMGTYLAVIILSIIVLLTIRGDDEGFVPNLSVLLCLILGVSCLVIFLYFVTTISNKIQVKNIIEDVYRKGTNLIDQAGKRDGFEEREAPGDFSNWYAIPSPIGGYIGSVNYHRLSILAKENNTRFYLGTARGMFVPHNFPLIQSERALDEATALLVLEAVSPIHQKFSDWQLPPVRLLTEIAVKAMSPGINDPGTAVDVMDRLTGLLMKLMNLPEYNFFRSEKKGGEVWFKSHHFEDVLATAMQQLRQYCKQDATVLRRIFQMLFHLLGSAGKNQAYSKAIKEEMKALLEDASKNLNNSVDRKMLADEIRTHRKALRHLFNETDFLLDAHLDEVGTYER